MLTNSNRKNCLYFIFDLLNHINLGFSVLLKLVFICDSYFGCMDASVDVNSVQALLLYNISDKELTAGELRTRTSLTMSRNWSSPAICIMPARASTAAPCESA
jgi:hypothetical protein